MRQKFPSHPIRPSENILFSVKDSHIHCHPHMPQPQKEYVNFSLESHFIIYVSNFPTAQPPPIPGLSSHSRLEGHSSPCVWDLAPGRA